MPIEDQKKKETFDPADKMLDPDKLQRRTEKMHNFSITTNYEGRSYTFLVSGRISKDDLMEKLRKGELKDGDGLKFSVYDKKAKKAYEINAETLMAHVNLENARIDEVVKKSAKKADKPQVRRASGEVAADVRSETDNVGHGGVEVRPDPTAVASDVRSETDNVGHGGVPVNPG